uniref:Uncharacterized protein n=1 Tax=Picea glauca TaxID=3330 RepID=A0A101LVT5_PICGL|nr:hypothetical protein ABT39_MTgene1884 [Picea glauca]QHR92526.1 hypothetical protein Q903MT_gene6572 [Picea sitchensis]
MYKVDLMPVGFQLITGQRSQLSLLCGDGGACSIANYQTCGHELSASRFYVNMSMSIGFR